MNEIEKIRLAIYESDDITKEDKKVLLEAVEDRKESANKVYLNAYKKAITEYRKDIKEIKSLLRNQELSKAYKKLQETKKSLNEVEKVVKDTPSDFNNTALSQLAKAIEMALISYTILKVLEPVIRKAEVAAKKKIMEKEKDLPKKKRTIKNTDPTFSANLPETFAEELGMMGLKDVVDTIRGKHPAQDSNTFKKMALNKIEKEKKILDKIESKIKTYI